MKLRLYLIFFFNIIDVISTLYVTNNGCVELNPIVGLLLKWPPAFVITKIILTALATNYLWQFRQHKISQIASWALVIEYGLIALYYALMFFYI